VLCDAVVAGYVLFEIAVNGLGTRYRRLEPVEESTQRNLNLDFISKMGCVGSLYYTQKVGFISKAGWVS